VRSVRTPTFWLLWLIYFAGAGAGLMVISSISGMAKTTMKESAFIAVAVMAIGNAAGRIGAGLLSDKIGRRWTLLLVLLFQAILMFVAIPVTNSTDGAKVHHRRRGHSHWVQLRREPLAFSLVCQRPLGSENFGMNYGILFTAWGAGSLLSSVAQRLKASSGNFDSSFQTAAALLIAGALLTFLIRPKGAVAPGR